MKIIRGRDYTTEIKSTRISKSVKPFRLSARYLRPLIPRFYRRDIALTIYAKLLIRAVLKESQKDMDVSTNNGQSSQIKLTSANEAP